MEGYSHAMSHGAAYTASLNNKEGQSSHSTYHRSIQGSIPITNCTSSYVPNTHSAVKPHDDTYQPAPFGLIGQSRPQHPHFHGNTPGLHWNVNYLDTLGNPNASNRHPVDFQSANISARPIRHHEKRHHKRFRRAQPPQELVDNNVLRNGPPTSSPWASQTEDSTCLDASSSFHPNTVVYSRKMPRGTQDQGGIMPQAGGNYGLTELEQMTTGVPTDDIEISSVDALSSVNDNTNQVSDRIAQWHSRTQSHDMGPYELNNAQKMFIQSWFTRFGQGQSHQTLVFDEVNALATSIKAPTPLVWGYIYNNISTKPLGLVLPGSVSPSTLYQAEAADAQPLYTATSLADLNPHIPPTILPQVEKYIQSAQGRLSRNDGRRRVNDGPLLCSFGCGYHTKRPYDWRRHEETHCPQDLWMCAVCRQEDEQNAFLVNRKDKCLKHVRNKHQNYNEEEVVDKSNLGFCGGTSFRCPHCAVVMATWEERCKHVLLHYEEDCGASQAGSGRSD